MPDKEALLSARSLAERVEKPEARKSRTSPLSSLASPFTDDHE